MADFGGIEIETPQEVLARLEAMQADNLQRAGQDPFSQRMARIENTFSSFAGQAQVMRAQNLIKMTAAKTSEALKALPPGASPQQQARARYEAMAAIADELDRPDIGIQAQNKLLELDQADFERSRLTAADERTKETHALNVEKRRQEIDEINREAALIEKRGTYRHVIKGAPGNLSHTAFRVDTEDGSKEFHQYMEENPTAVAMDEDTAASILFDNAGEPISKYEARDLRKTTTANLNAGRTALRFMEVLRENPDAFTAGEKGAAALSRVISHVESVANAVKGTMTNDAFADNERTINRYLEQSQITDARLKGLAVNLAYAIARQKDDQGRLSDTDVQMALRMIGGENGNPNPYAIYKTLEDNFFIQFVAHREALMRVPGEQMGPDVSAMLDMERRFTSIGESFRSGNESTLTTEQHIDRANQKRVEATSNRYKGANGVEVGF